MVSAEQKNENRKRNWRESEKAKEKRFGFQLVFIQSLKCYWSRRSFPSVYICTNSVLYTHYKYEPKIQD